MIKTAIAMTFAAVVATGSGPCRGNHTIHSRPTWGGGCVMSGSGTPGNISFAANIKNSCGYGTRAYATVENWLANLVDHYGATIYVSGSSKASWNGQTDTLWAWAGNTTREECGTRCESASDDQRQYGRTR